MLLSFSQPVDDTEESIVPRDIISQKDAMCSSVEYSCN